MTRAARTQRAESHHEALLKDRCREASSSARAFGPWLGTATGTGFSVSRCKKPALCSLGGFRTVAKFDPVLGCSTFLRFLSRMFLGLVGWAFLFGHGGRVFRVIYSVGIRLRRQGSALPSSPMTERIRGASSKCHV
jgi:hypothetical protein